MRLELQRAYISSISGSTKEGTLKVGFECPFNARIAEQLGVVEHLYDREGQNLVLRPFTKHTFGFGFPDAHLHIERAEGDPSPVTLTADLSSFEVKQDRKDGACVLAFRATLSCVASEFHSFWNAQRSEPCWVLVIDGKQIEMNFDSSPDEDGAADESQHRMFDAEEEQQEIDRAAKVKAAMK